MRSVASWLQKIGLGLAAVAESPLLLFATIANRGKSDKERKQWGMRGTKLEIGKNWKTGKKE